MDPILVQNRRPETAASTGGCAKPIRVAIVLLATVPAWAQTLEPAVAIVLEATGVVKCARECLTIPVPGELLRTGERLESQTGTGRLRVIECMGNRARIVEGSRFPGTGTAFGDCTLPQLVRLGERLANIERTTPALKPDAERDAGLVARMGAAAEAAMRRAVAAIGPSDAGIAASWERIALLQMAGEWDAALGAVQDFAERGARGDVLAPVVDALKAQRAAARTATRVACPVQREKVKVRALVVGISDFGAEQRLSPLRFAHHDARLFADLIERKVAGDQVEQLHLLPNDEATPDRVKKAFEAMGRNLTPDTVVWIYFASHGSVLNEGGKPQAVVHLSGPLPQGGVPALTAAQLEGEIDELAAQACQVHVVYDVCRAGALNIRSGVAQSNAERKQLNAALSRTDLPQPVYLLMASQQSRSAYEHEKFTVNQDPGHGIFTYVLARVIANSTASLSFPDMQKSVPAQVIDATSQRQQPNLITRREDASNETVAFPPRPPISFPAETPKLTPDELGVATGRGSIPSGPEHEAWAVVNRYLKGTESPPSDEDFRRCAEVFKRLWGEKSGVARAQEELYHFCRGRELSFVEGRETEAMEELSTALRLHPGAAYVLNAMGVMWLERGEFQRSLGYFREAVRLTPEWGYPRLNLALALTELGDYDGALAQYNYATRAEPVLGYLRYSRALLLARLGDVDDARAELKRLAAKPGAYQSDALVALGAIAMRKGKSKEARRLFGSVPGSLAARHNLALLDKLVDRQKAEMALEANVRAGYAPSMRELAEWRAKQDPRSAAQLYCSVAASERLKAVKDLLRRRARELDPAGCPTLPGR